MVLIPALLYISRCLVRRLKKWKLQNFAIPNKPIHMILDRPDNAKKKKSIEVDLLKRSHTEMVGDSS